MLPLARIWTVLGNLCVPAAFTWGWFIHNGSDRGALISAGYFGLLVTLVAAAVLVATFASYVRLAKKARAPTIAPPNTLFEDPDNRNSTVSWGTVAVFGLVFLAALVTFGNRYADSNIYPWDKPTSLADSFLGSRAIAYSQGCEKEPCFAMGQRKASESAKPLDGVAEYVLYVTDGAIVVAALLLLGAVVFLIAVLFPTRNAGL